VFIGERSLSSDESVKKVGSDGAAATIRLPFEGLALAALTG